MSSDGCDLMTKIATMPLYGKSLDLCSKLVAGSHNHVSSEEMQVHDSLIVLVHTPPSFNFDKFDLYLD